MPLTDPVPSSSFDVLERNIQDTDKFVNQETGTFTNRVGKVIKSIPVIEAEALEIVRSIGWNPAGEFATGFTYTKLNDVGRDASGSWWRYNGSDLPKVITAGTVPLSPNFSVISFETAANVEWEGGKSVGYALDDLQGFADELYAQGDIVDNGLPDALGNSKRVDAIVSIGDKRFVKNYKTVADAVADTTLKVDASIAVDSYYSDVKSGTLFFRVVPSGTGVHDGGKYIDMDNDLQLCQNMRIPLHPSSWGARGLIGYNDQPHIDKMITYFKSTLPTPLPNKNYQANGKCLDFSGMTNFLTSTIEMLGIDNLTFQNPSFIANSGFVGDQMLRVNSIDPSWYLMNFTLLNPFFDCAWNADLGFYVTDFLNFKIIGGKFTRYRKKGFKTANINIGSHEMNCLGTFFFQREFNEPYPVGITEGEAFEIANFDNNFTNVIIGFHKSGAATLVSGANTFINSHIYAGSSAVLRSLDTADEFLGCYFDSTPLSLNNRSTVEGCSFLIDAAVYAIDLPSNDPYRIKITNNRFRKINGAITDPAIKMKTIAEGRVNRPAIYDNTFDDIGSVQTQGKHPVNITSSANVFTVPDQYLPLGAFGSVSLASWADSAFADRLFTQSYNSVTKQITVGCYVIAGGAVNPSNLVGKGAFINLN